MKIPISWKNDKLNEKWSNLFKIKQEANIAIDSIIKFSVDWWNTLHQPASISKLSAPSIDPSMLKPLKW